jgi:hypothetical protein
MSTLLFITWSILSGSAGQGLASRRNARPFIALLKPRG